MKRVLEQERRKTVFRFSIISNLEFLIQRQDLVSSYTGMKWKKMWPRNFLFSLNVSGFFIIKIPVNFLLILCLSYDETRT